MRVPLPLRYAFVSGQAVLVLAGLATLSLWPPREGAMVLVALDGRDAGRLAAPALDTGLSLSGSGPFSNMLLVSGERGQAARLLDLGVIALAAPGGLCGPGART